MNNSEYDEYVEQATKAKKELADIYKELFNSGAGKRVIEDLTNKFIMNNSVSDNHQNVNYAAAYANGEGGVVKYIIQQLNTRL